MGTYRDRVAAVRSLAVGAAVARRGGSHPLRTIDVSIVADGLLDGAVPASIAEAQRRFADGSLTSVDLVRMVLARVDRLEPGLHTLLDLDPGVLGQAREADRRRAAGDRSPVLGVPVTVKDTIATAAPLRTTAGAELLLDLVADADAPVVGALRRAGAVVLGKANLSEFAGAVCRTPGFSAVGGQTVNPRGSAFSPGGSSSGSAAGVAAGLAMASIGTETSGSLIAPAAFAGVVAMKPSRGVLSSDGLIPLVESQDSPGPVGRTVADVSAVLGVLTDGALSAADPVVDGLRVGVLREDVASMRSAFEDTRDNVALLAGVEARLAAAGAVVVPATAPIDGQFEGRFLTVVLGGMTHDTVGWLRAAGAPVESLADLQAYNLRQPGRRMPKGQTLLALAVLRGVSAQAYQDAAQRCREEAGRALEQAFGSSGADVLLSVSSRHSPLYATGVPGGHRPGRAAQQRHAVRRHADRTARRRRPAPRRRGRAGTGHGAVTQAVSAKSSVMSASSRCFAWSGR